MRRSDLTISAGNRANSVVHRTRLSKARRYRAGARYKSNVRTGLCACECDKGSQNRFFTFSPVLNALAMSMAELAISWNVAGIGVLQLAHRRYCGILCVNTEYVDRFHSSSEASGEFHVFRVAFNAWVEMKPHSKDSGLALLLQPPLKQLQ